MLRFILILTVGLFSASASADTVCTGEVDTLGVGRSGVLTVSGPGGVSASYLCNVEVKINNVEPSVCKLVYSTLLAAQAQGKSVELTFNPSISSCSSLPSWGWAENFNWVFINK